MADKSRIEITSADDKIVGFDYQYYYFLLQLLKLGAGQSIGYEVKDDIHIDLPDNKIILLQLKHSVKTDSNITERDKDLWKTLSNWAKYITDKTEGRGKKTTQLVFLKNATFVLVSNKKGGPRNDFLNYVENLKDLKIKLHDFKAYLNKLHSETADSEPNKDLRNYMKDLENLDDDILGNFIPRIEFKLSEEDLIAKIKTEIKGYFIPKERIEDVYNDINSNLRDYIYLNIKSIKKIIISHDDFLNKFRNCFGQMSKLPKRNISPILPNNCQSQVFIKQLLDIGDINNNENEQIIKYTKLRLLLYNNMAQWIHNGELTGPQKEAFEILCLQYWNNIFRKVYRLIRNEINSGSDVVALEDRIIEASNECLNEIRSIVLKIENDDLDIELSNGQFYQLSEELKIGWHFSWESKYLNN